MSLLQLRQLEHSRGVQTGAARGQITEVAELRIEKRYKCASSNY